MYLLLLILFTIKVYARINIFKVIIVFKVIIEWIKKHLVQLKNIKEN